MMKRIFYGLLPLVTMALLISGCAGLEAETGSRQPAPVIGQPAPAPEPPVLQTAGSLWSERHGGLFRDVKAKDVGDIVTVAIYEQASATKEAKTTTGRSTSATANLATVFGFERDIANLHRAINPSALIDTEYDNSFAGSGTTSRKEDLIATLTTKVVEVLPNGNLRIDGGKTVRVNNENQIIRLSGIIRPSDISPRNIVDSKYILDARISYTGKGALSDKQKPGWLTRILDNVWPF